MIENTVRLGEFENESDTNEANQEYNARLKSGHLWDSQPGNHFLMVLFAPPCSCHGIKRDMGRYESEGPLIQRHLRA